ncbi:MAG: hypothetical protein ACI8RZ_005911 [Myxococcota bacterium]|jgi:hypothetical protein
MLTLLLTACIPAGTYALQALPDAEAPADFLVASGEAAVLYEPTRGWDLSVAVTIRNDGQGSPRVDLVNSHIRVNGFAWAPCRYPADVNQDLFFLTLSPGESVTRTLICEDVPQPSTGLELRFGATNAGGRGVVELSFGGVDP